MAAEPRLFDRRALLVGAAAALALLPAVGPRAARDPLVPARSALARLARAALDCVGRGDECIAHCLAEMRAGRSELADCASAVAELVAVCGALARLAALGSPQLPHFAAATAEVCRACALECRKYAEHEPCVACAEACERCLAECQALAA